MPRKVSYADGGKYNYQSHMNYLKAVANERNTPARINRDGMFRLVRGKWIRQEEFEQLNRVDTPVSFRISPNQAGSNKFLV